MNYVIQSGDTLSAIAKENGITQKAILDANPSISDANVINAGDTIIIPDDAVMVSGTSDPATNAALVKDATGSYAAQDCPLKDEWFTVKPVRYAVSDEDDTMQLPVDLIIGKQLPKLSEQHKYIVRELVNHTVYLFNKDEQYLLEIQYEDGVASDGKCVFGTAPDEVLDTLPLIKQKKDSVVFMWLTLMPLSSNRINFLNFYKELSEKAGQEFDFSLAKSGNAPDCRPLSEIEKLLAETQASTSVLKWTMPVLTPETDVNAIIVPYQVHTPENHYAVCLNDPIGITTDLCREFSIAYEVIMKSVASMQHPYQMAMLTNAIMEKAQKDAARNAATFYESPKDGYRINFDKETISENQKDAMESAKEDIEEYIHADELKQYLENCKNGVPELKDKLDTLAIDWLSWLKTEHLDLALSWFDDADKEHIEAKEALTAAMINNIGAVDAGVKLRSKWISFLFDLDDGKDVTGEDGIGAHILLALGYIGKKIITASKWLNAFCGTTSPDSSPQSIADARASIYQSIVEANPATDTIVESFSAEVARRSVAENRQDFGLHLEVLERRYGVGYEKVTARFGDVLEDLSESYMADIAIMTNNRMKKPGRKITLEQACELYDLEQVRIVSSSNSSSSSSRISATKNYVKNQSRIFAGQILSSEIINENSKVMKTYRGIESVFEKPGVKGSTLALFWVAQAYNARSLMKQAEESKSKIESSYLYINAAVGVISSTFAAMDHFAGKRFGAEGAKQTFTKYMEKDGAEFLGKGIQKGLNRMLTTLDINSVKMLQAFENVGAFASKTISFSFKSLPIIGAAFGTIDAFKQLKKDITEGQNGWAIASSVTSLVLNGAGLGLAILGLTVLGPLAAIAGVVIGVTSLILDGVHAAIADSEAQLLLKSSFWGTESYKYVASLSNSTLEERRKYFQTEDVTQDILDAIKKEYVAFCDYLYKPIAKILNYVKDDNDFSQFNVKIILQGFMPLTSNIKLAMSGTFDTKDTNLLEVDTSKNAWKVNKVNAKIALLSDTVAQLVFEINEKVLGLDFSKYKMNLSYVSPSGYPVVLDYKKVEIDDTNTFLWLFSDDATFNKFEVES